VDGVDDLRSMVAVRPSWGWKRAGASGYQGGRRVYAMKAFLLAIAALALLAAPAAAQMGGKRNGGADHAPTPDKPKVDEKAYKAALERIPDPKEKYDPWGGVAPAPATPAKKK
jgi:hypothetical protein